MKKTIISILILGGFVSGLTNCSDLKFGDGFLEKAPGGDVTVDTIFSSKLYADRVRQVCLQQILKLIKKRFKQK